jgi:hypothetical protein
MTKHFWRTLCCLCLCYAPLQAQKLITVNENCTFAVGNAQLTLFAIQKLDSLAEKALAAGDYRFKIIGFTDADGSEEYNQKLSKQRADAVSNYLINKGLVIEKTINQFLGESQPLASNDDEKGKSLNRRVEITADLIYYNSFSEIVKQQEDLAQEQFVINPFETNVVELSKGTIIEIPANVFCFEDGTEPTTGVIVSCIEAYDYADMIRFNLQTVSDGKMLETGGMLKITASVGERPLQLKPNKMLDITMPTQKYKEGMQVFVSESNDGNMNWKPTKRLIAKKKEKEKATIYDIDRASLNSVAWSMPLKPEMPIFGALPDAPIAPQKPKKPRQPVASKMPTPDKPLEEMSRKDRKKWEKQLEKNDAQKQQYQQLMQNYERNFAQYEKERERYEKELLPKYLSLKAIYDAAIKNRIQLVADYVQRASDYDASKIILTNLTKIKNAKITDRTPLDIDDICYELYQKRLTAMLNSSGALAIEKAFGRLSDTLKLSKIYALPESYKINANNTPDWSKKYLEELSYNALVFKKVKSFSQTSNFENALEALNKQRYAIKNEKEIKKRAEMMQRLANGKANSDEMAQYAMQVSTLNWINCDRFMNIPEAEKSVVTVKDSAEIKCYLVFKGSKSIISLDAYEENYYQSLKVPKNENFCIIAIKMKDGKAHFAKKDAKAGEYQPHQLVFEPCTVVDLMKKIDDLRTL